MSGCDSNDVESLYKNLEKIQSIFGIVYGVIYSICFIIVLLYSIYEFYHFSSSNEKNNNVKNKINTRNIHQISSEEQANIILAPKAPTDPVSTTQEEKYDNDYPYETKTKGIIFLFFDNIKNRIFLKRSFQKMTFCSSVRQDWQCSTFLFALFFCVFFGFFFGVFFCVFLRYAKLPY